MYLFLLSLIILIGGYFIYGALVERIADIDSKRNTPAFTRRDNVDYLPMSPWRVFLIQFLNIAGLGPIFGAIMGVMFGPAAFLWIVFGTIFGGAVHDFLSGVLSLRSDGASLPEIIGQQLGAKARQAITAFSVLLLLLVSAVFVLTPAEIIASLTPERFDVRFWIAVIFAYYILATLLPVDKVIGRIYPLFGVALLFMAFGIMGYMIINGVIIPTDINEGLFSRHIGGGETHPVFPMMFVSIACGAISGFHATQSPMMARCLTNERLARPIFYGAMVAEGIVALIWAAAAIAFTGGYNELGEYMSAGRSPGVLVKDISFGWLGLGGGLLAIFGVVAAPITTGDTALRSARLIISDFIHLPQKSIGKRLIISLPLFAVVFALMLMDFSVLWRYFAWSNQTLAMFTLWAVTVWIARSRPGWWFMISMVPAIFMTAVCVSYLLFAPSPEGFGLPLYVASSAGAAVAAGTTLFFLYRLPTFNRIYGSSEKSFPDPTL